MVIALTETEEKLVQDVKDKLRVSWNEDDDRILRMIKSAQADLNGLCNKQLDYDNEGKANSLMLERIFYDWNNALHEFRKNYQSEIIELSLLAATGGV